MLENPLDLIKVGIQLNRKDSFGNSIIPDAIYIPYLKRFTNIKNLLASLSWFKNSIYILVSNNSLLIDNKNNIKILKYHDYEISKRIKRLSTFNRTYCIQEIKNWDLPLKRNFAIWHSIKNCFDNILLIDDDIYNIDRTICKNNVSLLERNKISGSLTYKFPDTSVIGHIQHSFTNKYYPFLSGNCLFFKPKEVEGFFPLIYNEDWIFMLPSILDETIVYSGSVLQRKYNPYNNLSNVALQEFGEIISEGFFELIYEDNWNARYSKKFWSQYIQFRRSIVIKLLNVANSETIPFLNKSLEVSNAINVSHCLKFVSDWEKDMNVFFKLKNT